MSDLLNKIQNKPHPWYGVLDHWTYSKSKSAQTLVTLSDEEKTILYPSPSWADNRVVKMARAQLQQALAGNVMLPGEEELRITLLKNGCATRSDLKNKV